MPRPNPRRDCFLKHLRHEFPYKEDFIDHEGTIWPYDLVKEAVYSLKDNAPEILRVLNYHMFTPLPRTRIAEEVGFDPSTVKRKLDQAADNAMQRLRHGNFPPGDLFILRDPKTGLLEPSPFPKTFRNNW